MNQPNSSRQQGRGAPSEREAEWAGLMRAGLAGEEEPYRRLLSAMAPYLRAGVRRGLLQSGQGNQDIEDVVQEILLAVHLKRNTWLSDQPFLPWLNAIARHKLIDVLRRRGRRGEIPIDSFVEGLADQSEQPSASANELARLVGRLEGKQRSIVTSVSLDGATIRDTATRLAMTEGAVRVALHRGLRKLAALYRAQGT